MREPIHRRDFLATLGAGALAPVAGSGRAEAAARSPKIKLSLNLYSFNAPLRSGETTLEQVIDFCAELGFDAAAIARLRAVGAI